MEEEEVEAAVCACHTRRSAVSGRQRYLPIHRPAAALLSSAGRGSASDAAAPVILIGAPVEQEMTRLMASAWATSVGCQAATA